ncbi:hypothetical protein Tco_0425838 [Tanacetum coccineum]
MHITRPAQMKWLPKLMGYDNEVKYKKGVDNAAADAMSRVQNKGQLMYVMTVKMPKELSERIAASWDAYMTLKQVLEDLQNGKCNKKHYIWSNGKLLRKNKLVVGKDEQLRMDGMRKEMEKFVKECIIFQRYKPDLAAYPGLQRLPIPHRIWESMSMDFIEGFLKSMLTKKNVGVVYGLVQWANGTV